MMGPFFLFLPNTDIGYFFDLGNKNQQILKRPQFIQLKGTNYYNNKISQIQFLRPLFFLNLWDLLYFF